MIQELTKRKDRIDVVLFTAVFIWLESAVYKLTITHRKIVYLTVNQAKVAPKTNLEVTLSKSSSV